MSSAIKGWRNEGRRERPHREKDTTKDKNKDTEDDPESWPVDGDSTLEDAARNLRKVLEAREEIMKCLDSIEGGVATTADIVEDLGDSREVAEASLRTLRKEGTVNHRVSGETELWWLENDGSDEDEDIPEPLESLLRERNRPGESLSDTLSRIRGNPDTEILRDIFVEPTESADEFREAINSKKESSDMSDLVDSFR